MSDKRQHGVTIHAQWHERCHMGIVWTLVVPPSLSLLPLWGAAGFGGVWHFEFCELVGEFGVCCRA
jgi:hypothetical protein